MHGMTSRITKDTRLCMSLSGRPGNTGTRFHNHLYEKLGLDYVYKAFTTTDIVAAIGGVRALGIRGCAISMPWKEDVIPLVDEMTESATAIESVNTIVNDDGHLTAYNTDYLALRRLLAEHDVPRDATYAVLGSGGMAKAAVAALVDSGFGGHGVGTVVARNPRSGPALAQKYRLDHRESMGDLRPQLILNATPFGMAGGSGTDDLADRMPVDADVVRAADVVFDVVAMPAQTPLVRCAQDDGVHVITGDAVMAWQAAEQFTLYTGVQLTDEQVREASEYSRR